MDSKFTCGDPVVAHGIVFGYITAVLFRGNSYLYEVSYFSNGMYEQRWFESFEIAKVDQK